MKTITVLCLLLFFVAVLLALVGGKGMLGSHRYARGNLNSPNLKKDKAATTSTTSTTTTTTTTPPNVSLDERPRNSNRSKKVWRYESRLLRYLFASEEVYNNEIRPAKHLLEPVVVTIEFVLRQITDLIEKSQQIGIAGFLKITWLDERLMWDSEHFGGVEWIVVPTTSVWLPDIALVNSEQMYFISRDSGFPVTLTASGELFFVPAGKIYARCNFDLRYFPFDYQLCKYRFESWVYTAEYVTLVGTNFTVDVDHYVDSPQWEIKLKFVKTSIAKYEDYNFSRVEFYLLLRRKSVYFITYTIFPCFALSTLQVISHMLPFTDKERVNFATAILVAFSVFHVSIVDQLPKTSHGIPLLAIYIDGLLCLIGLSLVECFVMINWLSRVECSCPSPVWWNNIVEKWGNYVFLGSDGRYWRRHYLRIYHEVCVKQQHDAELRRAEAESRRLARVYSFTRTLRNFGLINDSDSSNDGGANNSKRPLQSAFLNETSLPSYVASSDVPAIRKMAERWGWQMRRTSVPPDVCQVRVRAKAEDTDNVVRDMDELDTVADLCIGSLQSNLPFNNNGSDNSNEQDVGNNNNNSYNSEEDNDLSSPSSNFSTPAASRASSFDARLSTINIACQLSRTVSSASIVSNSKSKRRLQNEWQNTERSLTTALAFLREMGQIIKSGLHAHNLRRECVQLWATFITVVDRMVSAFLIVLCALTPIALFVVLPELAPIPPLPVE